MIRPDTRAQLQLALTRTLNENNGQLPRANATALADALGVSARAVFREASALKNAAATAAAPADLRLPDLAEPAMPETQDESTSRGDWWADEEAQAQVLAALGGCPTVAAAWRQLGVDGLLDVGYPAFTKQLKRHLPPAVHAGLTAQGNLKGRQAYIDASLYCTEVTEGRNTRWQADVQYVPVRVRSTTGAEYAEAYQITFLDEATRMVMATMFTFERPTGADVAATIAAAVMGRTDADGNFFGGLPQEIRWDNGAEFLNEVVTQVCAILGIIPIPSPPHTGWRKGKIERFHRTMQQRFFSTLKGSTQGPKTFTGKRPWRGANDDLMFRDSFLAAALAGVTEYNEVHRHNVLGCTPAQAWLRDTQPIRKAPPAALHPLMLALPRLRVVAKDGISYCNVKYLSPTLAHWRRRKVEIRVLPHDVERIYVFDPKTAEFICEAIPAPGLSATDRQRLLLQRSHDYRQVQNAIATGTARRAEEALIEDVLTAETARRNTARAASEEGATPNPAGAEGQPDTEAHVDEPDEDGDLRPDIDRYLEQFGDDT